MQQMNKPINDKNITLKFSLGEINLRKPTKWNLKSHKNVRSKVDLQENEFLKYALFYSQDNTESKYYSMADIDSLSSEEINSLLKALINSDKDLMQSSNVEDFIDDKHEVYKILNNYLKKCSMDMLTSISAFALHLSIHLSWIDALNGKLDDESKIILGLSSLFKQLSQESSSHSKAIDSLKEFDNYKEDFHRLCTVIDALIKKLR
jgi:hypothetical protein